MHLKIWGLIHFSMYKISAVTASKLIQQHQDELTHYLIQRNHCSDVASDILQDAYLRLINASPDKEIKNTRAYLYKIVNNLAID